MLRLRSWMSDQGVRVMIGALITLGLLAGLLLFVVAPWLWTLARPWLAVVM